MRMTCYNCKYGHAHYLRGMCYGVDCALHNLTFIPASEIEERGACPAWAEKDD